MTYEKFKTTTSLCPPAQFEQLQRDAHQQWMHDPLHGDHFVAKTQVTTVTTAIPDWPGNERTRRARSMRVKIAHRGMVLGDAMTWSSASREVALHEYARHSSGRISKRTTLLAPPGRSNMLLGRPQVVHAFIWPKNMTSNSPDAIARKAMGTSCQIKACWPLAEHYGFAPDGNTPEQFVAAFDGAVTPRELSVALFGHDAGRKDLVRTVGASDAGLLQLAWSLTRGVAITKEVTPGSNCVPVDWIVGFLRINASAPMLSPGADLHTRLSQLDIASRRRLLARTISEQDAFALRLGSFVTADVPALESLATWTAMEKADTALHSQHVLIQAEAWANAQCAQELREQVWIASDTGVAWIQNKSYDDALAENRRRQEEIDQRKAMAIAAAKSAAALNALAVKLDALAGTNTGYLAPYRIMVANNVAQLTAWGTILDNCVGKKEQPYIAQMEAGTTLIVAVLHNDKETNDCNVPIACAEINTRDNLPVLRELLGRRNKSMPHIKPVFEELLQLAWSQTKHAISTE